MGDLGGAWRLDAPADGRRVVHLDGLRGVAIALVLAAHLMQKVRPFPGKSYVASLGGLGVYVFFALSGYLITGLLVREHQRAGRVSLRNFYVRRCLRIMPAFYLMIMVTLALAMLLPTVVVTERQALEASLFVANNTSAPMGWWLAHTWSLGVEEKFYLLWPLALVWLRPDRGLTFAAVAVVVEPVIRTVCFVLVPAGDLPVGVVAARTVGLAGAVRRPGHRCRVRVADADRTTHDLARPTPHP